MLSLFKSTGHYRDVKWIDIQPEPTSSSLVSAVLPEDVLHTIVLAAAHDPPTALRLALVSKAVGRIAESVIYAAVVLRSFDAARTFAETLRTKSRILLESSVSELVLQYHGAAPCVFDGFWFLVGQRCPRIRRLSIFAADLKFVRELRPQHLHVAFGRLPAHALPNYSSLNDSSAFPNLWRSVTHLNLYMSTPVPLVALGTTNLPSLTHFACSHHPYST
ncbi:hypothetical protein B0H10DRAFT_880829 [Mycena sp. CBHHK59/15]|nr:hypothetical protein B0H10DRAFT_880829 [Mycena sp. CBHHK59/15]